MKKGLLFLVIVCFCLAIGNIAIFAQDPEGTIDPTGGAPVQPTKYVTPKAAIKAPEAKIKKYKNSIKISRNYGTGTKKVKTKVNTKGLTDTQKTTLAKYAGNLAKKYNKKYKNKRDYKSSKEVVNAIAKKVKAKVKSMKTDNKIKQKRGKGGFNKVKEISEATGYSRKAIDNYLDSKGIKTAGQTKAVAKELQVLMHNANENNEISVFLDTKKYLDKAINNVHKGIHTKEIDPYERFFL